MRAAMAAATGSGGAGRCATIVVALVLGREADPEIRSRVTVIASFLAMMRKDPGLRRRCEDA